MKGARKIRDIMANYRAGRTSLTGSALLHQAPISQAFGAGWSSPVARQAHNLKVVGSNPTPATKFPAKSVTYNSQAQPGCASDGWGGRQIPIGTKWLTAASTASSARPMPRLKAI